MSEQMATLFFGGILVVGLCMFPLLLAAMALKFPGPRFPEPCNWERVFAWHPVRVRGRLVWWRRVERRAVGFYQSGMGLFGVDYQYRLPEQREGIAL